MSIRNFFRLILCIRYKYLIFGSIVITERHSKFKLGRNVALNFSVIYLRENCSLIIGNNNKFYKTRISVSPFEEKACVLIGDNNKINKVTLSVSGNCIIGKGNILETFDKEFNCNFSIQGTLQIGDYNRIRSVLWSRFGGEIIIGNRNTINQRTEIRADEIVTIGNYTRISYDCVIWDTNTHSIHPAVERRKMIDKYYPIFGFEYEKPETKPVFIGDDCWLGRGVAVLKGCIIHNKCIVGYRTIISQGEFPENSTIVNRHEIRVIRNDL